MTAVRVPTRKVYAESYYLRLITALARCVNLGLSHAATAQYLNSSGIHALSMEQWNGNAVMMALKKIREHQRYPSQLHKHILRFLGQGKIQVSEVSALFRPAQLR